MATVLHVRGYRHAKALNAAGIPGAYGWIPQSMCHPATDCEKWIAAFQDAFEWVGDDSSRPLVLRGAWPDGQCLLLRFRRSLPTLDAEGRRHGCREYLLVSESDLPLLVNGEFACEPAGNAGLFDVTPKGDAAASPLWHPVGTFQGVRLFSTEERRDFHFMQSPRHSAESCRPASPDRIRPSGGGWRVVAGLLFVLLVVAGGWGWMGWRRAAERSRDLVRVRSQLDQAERKQEGLVRQQAQWRAAESDADRLRTLLARILPLLDEFHPVLQDAVEKRRTAVRQNAVEEKVTKPVKESVRMMEKPVEPAKAPTRTTEKPATPGTSSDTRPRKKSILSRWKFDIL